MRSGGRVDFMLVTGENTCRYMFVVRFVSIFWEIGMLLSMRISLMNAQAGGFEVAS